MAEPCDRCGGTGQITYHKQATKEQFWSVMGKPIKKQHVGGTYTRYWYYKCRDGLIQLRVWYVPSTKSFGWNDPSLY